MSPLIDLMAVRGMAGLAMAKLNGTIRSRVENERELMGNFRDMKSWRRLKTALPGRSNVN